QEAADTQQQHRDRIGQPMLFAFLDDAGQPVETGLDRPQERREESAFTLEDTRHVPAERLHERDDDRAVDRDLDPAIYRHDRAPRNPRVGAARRRDKSEAPRRRSRKANSRTAWVSSYNRSQA